MKIHLFVDIKSHPQTFKNKAAHVLITKQNALKCIHFFPHFDFFHTHFFLLSIAVVKTERSPPISAYIGSDKVASGWLCSPACPRWTARCACTGRNPSSRVCKCWGDPHPSWWGHQFPDLKPRGTLTVTSGSTQMSSTEGHWVACWLLDSNDVTNRAGNWVCSPHLK